MRKERCAAGAEDCTEDKDGNDADVGADIPQKRMVAPLDILVEIFHAVFDVADAHGRGGRHIAEALEGLDLDGAGEGNDAVCSDVVFAERNERIGQEQSDLDQEDALVAVQKAAAAEPVADDAGDEHTGGKAEDGQCIAEYAVGIAVHDIDAEQEKIAGLRIGKDLAASHIGVGVLKAADQREQRGEQKGFTDFFCFRVDFISHIFYILKF